MEDLEPIFFESQDELRKWFKLNHRSASELWIGYFKKNSSEISLNRNECLGQALCFGWIESLVRSIDKYSYRVRYTPRKTGSHWSWNNIRLMQSMIDLGLAEPNGLKAFQSADFAKAKEEAHSRKSPELTLEFLSTFQANQTAWTYFKNSSPGYRKSCVYWVAQAKQHATQTKRLKTLIECCDQGRKIPPFDF